MGIGRPAPMRWRKSSSPVIEGMFTSAIKHDVSPRRADARKSAADGKTSTVYPSDLMSLRMDSRKGRSSSMIEIRNWSTKFNSGISLGTRIRLLIGWRRPQFPKHNFEARLGAISFGLDLLPIRREPHPCSGRLFGPRLTKGLQVSDGSPTCRSGDHFPCTQERQKKRCLTQSPW